MKITLISPRLAVQKGDFLGSGVPYMPLELAVVAAFLREQGDHICVLDLFGSSPTTLESKRDHYLQGEPFTKFLDTPEIEQADLVIIYAISVMSDQEILAIIRDLRQSHPQMAIAVLENSQAVTAYAVSQLAEDFFEAGVDALLCGEIYWNWHEISTYLTHRQTVPVPENVMVSNPPPSHTLRRKVQKHPTYPIPAWDLFNLNNYWSIPYSHGPKTRRFLPILTSRGCPYPCDFCVVPETNNQQWRDRTAENVVTEMIVLRDRFNVRHFQVEDLNPTVRHSRWTKICQLLIERQAGIFFYFVSGTKAETVKLEQIPLYAQAGCRYLSISPESGSPAVLKAIGKPFNYAHGLALIEACHRQGIYTQACLLVGHPAETVADYELSCDYLCAMVQAGLDEVAIFIVAPLAGSQLHRQNKIELDDSETLTSFSPQGRRGWEELKHRRRQLIQLFFWQKLKRGPGLWLQGIRAVLGIPRTKMENLPRRVLFIYWLLLKRYWRQTLSSSSL